MKTEIEQLIQEHIIAKQEVFSLLEELSKLSDSKLSKKDKEALECQKIILENENSLRLSFISELELLIGGIK